MMKKYALILPLLLVVIVSGCVSQGTVNTDPNRGITINSFTASPSETKAGRDVLFDLELENIGGTTARNIIAELYGVEGQWRDSSGDLIDSTLPEEVSQLNPPDTDTDTMGGFRTIFWDLTTPNVPQGISPEYTVQALVTYDYNTSGRLDIVSVSSEEMERKTVLGESVVSPFTVINSAGPIKITVPERYKTPIIVDTEDEQDQTFPLRIELINVGDGWPVTDDVSGNIKGTIDLYGPGVEFSDCLGVTSGTTVDLGNADIITRFRDSGSVPIGCEIKIDKDVWGNRAEDRISLIFNIFYRYYVKETTNVRITGN
jgi:hypothetical protein